MSYYRKSRRSYSRMRSRTAIRRRTTQKRRPAPASIFNKYQIVAIVRKAMARLKKNQADRMFYTNAYRLVYYVGMHLLKSSTGRYYEGYLRSATQGLTTGKTKEEIEKIEADMERVKVRFVNYFNGKLNVPYLKEFEEAITIDTALENTLSALKYEKALEDSMDAAEEELIEEEFVEIEDSLELDFFSFPQFIHFLTEGLKAIGKEAEVRTNYYVTAGTFIEQVEDAIIKSWFGQHYLAREVDADGDSSYKIKNAFQPTVPSNPSWAASLEKRLTYLKLRLMATIAPQVNAFFLKEDQETIMLKMIVEDVVDSLKVGTNLKEYSGDLEKHEKFLTDVDFEEFNEKVEAAVQRYESYLQRVDAMIESIDDRIFEATADLQKRKQAMEAQKAKIEAFLGQVNPA